MTHHRSGVQFSTCGLVLVSDVRALEDFRFLDWGCSSCTERQWGKERCMQLDCKTASDTVDGKVEKLDESPPQKVSLDVRNLNLIC
jgi:hypothetical protein